MKTLRYHARRDFRIEDHPPPVPGPGEVGVRVRYCGICGSDVHEYTSGLDAVPTRRPHPQTGRVAPVTGGHEFTGDVVEVGAGVSGVSVGDRVAVRPTLPCYQCRYCREGRQSQCAVLATIGLSADGAFAEYTVVRQDCLVPLPESVSYESGTYAEPLACGVHAVKRSRLAPGASVAVVGVGTIGLMTLQAALASGAGAAYVFDPDQGRRATATRLGAADAFDPAVGDPGKALAARTGGMRADVVFECSGAPSALSLADSLAGRGGVIVSMGFPAHEVSLPLFNLFVREKSILFSAGYDNEDYLTAMAFLAADRVKAHPLLTSATIPLDEILTRGFEKLTGPDRLDYNKILVRP